MKYANKNPIKIQYNLYVYKIYKKHDFNKFFIGYLIFMYRAIKCTDRDAKTEQKQKRSRSFVSGNKASFTLVNIKINILCLKKL